MKKKYYNDAYIGNNNITASFSETGEMLRMYFPYPDYRQFIDQFHVGIKVNDSNIIYLHDDVNNRYNQYYTENTNILNTEIYNTYFNVKTIQTDCCLIDSDVIVRKYTFRNENNIDLNLNLLVHSKVLSSYNNMAGSLIHDDALVQYSHNFTWCILSKQKLLSYQLNGVEHNISSGTIGDKDYIGMNASSAISYNIGLLHPGEERTIEILIYMKYDEMAVGLIRKKIDSIRAIKVDKEIEKTRKYWNKFVKEHELIDLSGESEELKKVFRRTILFMPLLMNNETGGVAASLEVDEERDQSGRYSYCWPRDAVTIYHYLDYLGFQEISRKFYEVFLAKTQSESGMWEQRFYTDGRLAPCWGYQIDETAAVIVGAYHRYVMLERNKNIHNIEFLKNNVDMLEKAANFLIKYFKNLVGELPEEEKTLILKRLSYDLWENEEGVHTYSMSAIYAAFDSMSKIYKELDIKKEKVREYEEYRDRVKQYILDNLVDHQRNILVRNTNDDLADVSVMGAVYPFRVFDPDDIIVKNTIEYINMNLRTYSGGYLRYQNDPYIGGNNPWIVTTAMMAKVFKMQGNMEDYEKCKEFIVKSANVHGILSEQANSDLNDRWVVGLAWSHAVLIGILT